MKVVFADTSFWWAHLIESDQWNQLAARAISSLGEAQIVTSDLVLTEFLNGHSSNGFDVWERAVRSVHTLLGDPYVTIIEASRPQVLAAIVLYERRPDKGSSLTDCVSMVEMRRRRIQHALTSDRHFEQEGFTILMK